MTAKQLIIDELNKIEPVFDEEDFIEAIARWVIADRLRVVAPLVDYKKNKLLQGTHWLKEIYCYKSIDETLKNAGVSL